MNSHTSFSTWIDDYLAVRRRAGFQLETEGSQLRKFARFAEQVGHAGPLTVRLAVQWASSSRSGRALTAARRIEVLRPFASYCRQFDPATEIPPRCLFGHAHRRLAPHVFTDDEVLDLLGACDHLYPPGGLRGLSCKTIFGLMAATGLRVSEVKRPGNVGDQSLLHFRGASRRSSPRCARSCDFYCSVALSRQTWLQLCLGWHAGDGHICPARCFPIRLNDCSPAAIAAHRPASATMRSCCSWPDSGCGAARCWR
ncbi:integrase family protein [Caballeronia arationis]|nr:integrase family protein [Caballeronia arationis]